MASTIAERVQKNQAERLRVAGTSLAQEALWVRDHIVNRTRQGLSVHGAAFAPYRDLRYKGRLSPVDLLRSGQMLGSVRRYRRGRAPEVRWGVHVQGAAMRRRALFHQLGTRKMAARPWFGVTPAMRQEITRRVFEAVSTRNTVSGQATTIEIALF